MSQIRVEIDGVGTVELDSSFSDMDPAEQEAIINDIVSQHGGSRTNPQQQPPQQQPPTNEVPTATPEGDMPAADGDNFLGGNGDYLSEQWFDDQEARYQESLNSGAYPQPSAEGQPQTEQRGFFSMPRNWDEVLRGLATGTGDIVEGAGDVLGMLGNPLNQTINAVTGSNLSTDLGGSLRQDLGFPEGTGLQSEIQSGIAGGLLTGTLAASGGKAAGNVLQRSLYELGRTPVRDAVAGGTAAGAAGLAEDAGLGPGWQMAAGLAGGMGGYVASGLPQAATRSARDARFATREARQNPYAAYDAEIAQDIAGLTRDRAVSPTDPTGRAAVTATQINSLERSYTSRFRDMITSSELDEPLKRRLRDALDRDDDIPIEELDALREIPTFGDAVADAVIKRQRLRQLTPELKTRTGALSRVADVMDFIPGIPGIVPRGIRSVARASGDGEAARVNAAERLIQRENAYRRLSEITGPSGARESSQALWDAADAAATAQERAAVLEEVDRIMNPRVTKAERGILREYLSRQGELDLEGDMLDETYTAREVLARRRRLANAAARQADDSPQALRDFDEQLAAPPPETPEARITRNDRAEFRRSITDPALAEADVQFPARTEAQIARSAQTRRNALTRMEQAAADWEAQLADPSTAPQPRQVELDPVDRMVEQGIQGEFRALDSLATSTGMNREDASRVLKAIGESNPDLARDVGRVIAGHNTSNARMGPILRPMMRAEMERLGITPQAADSTAPRPSTPPDPEVQARLDQLDERTRANVDPSNITQRELDLMIELDQVDPIRGTLGDGTPFRDSEAGLLQERPEEAARATAIRDELTRLEGERNMRRIDRPMQWEQGRNRYQSQANDAIARLQQDSALDADVLDIIGNAPVQIRDNFRTTAEAEAYINERVLPDLEAEGYSQNVINRVRVHLLEVAQAKPYANQEAYEAGTSYRSPGRPRNED